jgi:hypothetical protein
LAVTLKPISHIQREDRGMARIAETNAKGRFISVGAPQIGFTSLSEAAGTHD